MKCFVPIFSAALALGQTPRAPVIDNPQVRVMDVTSAAGSRTALHRHPLNRVMIYMDAGQQTISYEDGRVEKINFRPGQALWSPAGPRHTAENTGGRPFRVIEVELKNNDGKRHAMPATPFDPVKTGPGHYRVEMENDQVRVMRARYGPREKGALHEHVLNRVVVFLTDQNMLMTEPNGQKRQGRSKAGDIHWAGRGKHSEENLNGTPFEVVVVELKQ